MNKFKVTKASSPQQMHTRIIERTATIHSPSIIPTTAHDSTAKSSDIIIKLLESLATVGFEALSLKDF